MSRLAVAALLAASVFAAIPAAHAQEAEADMTAFGEACVGAEAFLLGEVPEGIDPASILTPLCACLDTGFKVLPQADVDILAADLRGEGTEELHAAHGDYGSVEDKARDVLNACYASPEISSLMTPPDNPAPEDSTEPADDAAEPVDDAAEPDAPAQ